MDFKAISKKHAEAKLYGNIGNWFINGDSFSALLDDVEAKGYEELTLRMHCYGGSVIEGNVMYNAMQRSNLKINIAIDGVAASMGCFILPAIKNVVIAENGFGLLHRPRVNVEGDSGDLNSAAKLLTDMENDFVRTLTERTKMTADEIRAKWFDSKDHWLNADEMVQYGLAEKKIPATAKNINDLNKEIVSQMSLNDVYSKFAASLDKTNIHKKVKQKMELSLLIAAFQLEGVTAESSEAVVLAALKAKFDKQAERIGHLEAEAQAKTDSTIKAALDKAVAEGKIKPVEGQSVDQARAVYENIGKTAGIDALTTVLANIIVKQPIAEMIVREGRITPEGGVKNWDWYQKNDPNALEKMQKENPDQFKELFKAEYGSYPA